MTVKSRRIEWEAVKTRLREREAALEKAAVAGPLRREDVYRLRAAQLAGRRTENAPCAQTLPVLAFGLGSERYGIEVSALAEVFPFARCTPLPGAPPALLGLINLRGEICSVVDLAQILGLTMGADRAAGHVVLLHRDGVEVGLRVDQVEKIDLVDPDTLGQPSDGDSVSLGKYIQGLTPDHLIVLNIQAVLSHPALKSNSK